ncbi:MAG TPA: protease modulator HflC [Candidatus Sulfotelmatobacter sp.]|nr:protease modulator HflC [Candidatus Sulfotelmatobacter sp.]
MNRPGMIAGIVILVVVALVGSGAFFTVTQYQQALVLRFGAVDEFVKDPGLHLKIPVIQDVLYFDNRVLEVDPPPQQVILGDQKRVDVDAYAVFRITNPLQFYQTVTNESGARSRLAAIINSSMRRVLGSVPLASVLSAERERIMTNILHEVGDQAKRFGIEIVDVRLRRADLPGQTSQAIYDRMKSERDREAKEARGQGQEQALEIRARADREKIVLLAEAAREAQIVRGEGDAAAIKIYADAFGKDPQFFAFYRSMQAYQNALANSDTSLVLSPDMDFLRYLEDPSGALKPATGPKPPASGAH